MASAEGHIQLPSEGDRTVHGHSAHELRVENVMRLAQISQIPGLSPARLAAVPRLPRQPGRR
jgi:hypothetical protein